MEILFYIVGGQVSHHPPAKCSSHQCDVIIHICQNWRVSLWFELLDEECPFWFRNAFGDVSPATTCDRSLKSKSIDIDKDKMQY
eukprot:scaffold3016_cov114-Skeletonema_dohrnii-CCMP3373.AAC.9